MKICGTKFNLVKAILFYQNQIELQDEIIMNIQEIISKFPANILNRD